MIPLSVTADARAFRALLLGAFLLRAVFAFAIPAWQSPDEYPHYWIASSIARGDGYPAGSPAFPRYEAYQPPLYYFCLAGVITLTGLPVLEYSETPDSPPLPLVLLRLMSVFFGVAVVAATWSVVSQMFPGDPSISFFAAAFSAFLPTFVGLSASLNNDGLVVLFSSLFLGFVLRPSSRWTPGSCLGAGFLLGAGIATKLAAILLFPVLAYSLIVARRADGGKFRRLVLLFVPGIVVGVAVLAARNMLVYGDLFVITPGVPREFAVTDGQIVRALRNMAGSFWLAFGRTYDVHLSRPAYVLGAGLLTLAALVGWWKCRKTPAVRSNALLVAVPAGLGAAASLAFTLSYPPGTQTSWGKNLYPLLPLLAAGAAFGWTRVIPRSPRAVPWLATVVLLAGSVWGLIRLTE